MFLKKRFWYFSLLIVLCLVISGFSTFGFPESVPKLSFAVLADPRNGGDTWKNALLEIRDRSVNPEPKFDPAEVIIIAGDMDPLESRYNDYKNIFTNVEKPPTFLPVIGNHEFENWRKHFRYARDTIIPSIPNAVRRHPNSCDYYLDYKNVRIIILDGYTDLGKRGVINRKGRQWVEQVIKSAPLKIDHIFISFHEPAFPRYRHLEDSFNQKPKQRNAFWQMLLKNKDKVRAVFVGHTHYYYRMRILNPAGIPANDMSAFPDENGGIYQVDAGAAGNGYKNTVVQVQIKGKKVFFRVLQADNGSEKPFNIIDEWEIVED
jgi:hypothetical protein